MGRSLFRLMENGLLLGGGISWILLVLLKKYLLVVDLVEPAIQDHVLGRFVGQLGIKLLIGFQAP